MESSGDGVIVDTLFNGKRAISAPWFPYLTASAGVVLNPFSQSGHNSNDATSSIVDFLNAVFYPNTPPRS